MIVQLSRTGAVDLADAGDFGRFKVSVAASPDGLEDLSARVSSAVRFDGEDTAWVDIAVLRALNGDATWQVSLSQMIEKAAPHGWISPDRSAIKAHVEWSA